MKETIMLSDKQQRTHDILMKLINGEIKNIAAQKLLGLGQRQVIRKKQALLKQGVASLIHGNTGQVTPWSVTPTLQQKVIRLYQTQYLGWNFTHFHETITRETSIKLSARAVAMILHQAGIESPQKHHRQRRSHPPRERKEFAGELIQVDASKHQWLYHDSHYYHLHGGIDDATGKVVGAYLEEQETIHGYQMVLQQCTLKYGLAACWYSDFRTIFQSTKQTLTVDEELSGKRLQNTKFTRLMNKLGIDLISTTNPRAKGKIERLRRTFQDRLAKELDKQKITTLQAANEYLTQVFLPHYNARFSLPIKDSKNMFVPVEADFGYNFHLAVWQERSVHHHCYLRHYGQYLLLLDPQTNQSAYLLSHTKVNLYTLLDGSYLAVTADRKQYPVRIVDISDVRASTTTTTQSIISKPHHSHPPAANHPWRRCAY
jgi:transposase